MITSKPDTLSVNLSNNTSQYKITAWVPRLLDPEMAFKKMWKNSTKAFKEHLKNLDNRVSYLPIDKALPPLDSLKQTTQTEPLQFECSVAEAQGCRSTMEDAHLFKETDNGILTAICDGHGGSEIAKFATEYLEKNFIETLQNNQGNVHTSFEIIFNAMDKEVKENKKWEIAGSTIVVSYIDKNTNLVYTATLGDSEANIYRKDNDSFWSIPLSCVRDWASPKDAIRAGHVLNNSDIATKWPEEKNPKILRMGQFNRYCSGINVARSIGDYGIEGIIPLYVKESPLKDTPNLKAISSKPKITINKLLKGDVLVLACDGVKDFTSEEDLINILSNPDQHSNTAQKIVDFAIKTKYSTDNASALVIRIT